MTRKTALLALLLALVAAGCVSAPVTPPPAVGTALAQMDSRGERLSGRYGVFLAPVDGSEFRQIYGGNRLRNYLRVSPDGEWALFVEYTGDKTDDGVVTEADIKSTEIGVMRVDGSEARLLSSNENIDITPAWAPDGEHVVFASDRDNEEYQYDLFVMDLDGQNVVNITNTPDVIEVDPSWGDTTIALIRLPIGEENERPKSQAIWTLDCDVQELDACGGNVRQLTFPVIEKESENYIFGDSSPRFSPDGESVAFYRHRNEDWSIGNFAIGDIDIMTISLEGGAERLVSQGSEADINPAWSPDGERFVLTTLAPSDSEENPLENVNDLVVMDVDGGNRRKVEGEIDVLFEQIPDWVPAGALDDNDEPWLIFSAEWWDGNPEGD
jgi:Tol biopolymer transport system component